MILTGKAISAEVKRWNIVIDPFDTANVNPNSYNYRLCNILKVFEWTNENWKPLFSSIEIDNNWYTLIPNQMYLASTYETIGSDKYMISLIGRSSLGRLWLFLQLSANVWHIWTCHKRTLELVCSKPLKIYPFIEIWQVSFWENKWNISHYNWDYKKFDAPQESLFS
jgi:dCTP deaminase